MKIETRKGLWVSSSFAEKFGNKNIEPAKTVLPFKKLQKIMSDSEIKSELGIVESILADVAAFLENPPEGTDDGYANIFYIAGCVVSVRWISDGREWGVRTWDLGVGRWHAGGRAFGRNSLSEPLISSDPLALGLLEARLQKLEDVLKTIQEALTKD